MKSQKVFNRVDNVFHLVYYFAKLNLLFIAYTLRGAIVLGIFPALCALMQVIANRDVREVSSRMRCDFYQTYKSSFKKGNAVGWMMALIGLIFYMNFLAMSSGRTDYSLFNVIPFFTLLLLYIVVTIWVFPLYIHSNLSLISLLKYSLVIGVGNSHYTLIIVILLFLILYLSLSFPALLLFFAFSILTYIVFRLTYKPISYIDFNKLN